MDLERERERGFLFWFQFGVEANLKRMIQMQKKIQKFVDDYLFQNPMDTSPPHTKLFDVIL